MSDLNAEKLILEKLKKLPIVGKQPANEKEETFLREICEFEFINLEESKLAIKFPYGSSKNKHNFTFFPGGKYKLPRFIAKWMESRTTPEWEWRPNGLGGLEKKHIGNKPRFQMRQTFGG